MHYYHLILSSLFILARGTPISEENLALSGRGDVQLPDGTVITISGSEKRAPDEVKLADGTKLEIHDEPNRRKRSPNDVQLHDGSWLLVRDIPLSKVENRRELGKRENDKISSCGPKSGWMPIDDHGEFNGFPMWGYKSTVEQYCARISYDLEGNPVIVAAGKATSYTVRWARDQEGILDDMRDSRVGLKGGVPGHIEFEVHNKRDNGQEYVLNEEDCIKYLMHMADPKESCYGKNNHDTKGGTWQMENNDLTFHALPADETNTGHDELR